MRITRDQIKIQLSIFPTKKYIDKWFADRNVFFLLGIGRSGTKFLSDLLNEDKNAIIFHEPIPEDFDAFCTAHKNEKSSLKYLTKYRKKKMYSLVSDKSVETYGEVNSALRYHGKQLKKCFPNAKTVHLIRDGREVVRSFMSRKHYEKGSKGHHALMPVKNDPYYFKWDTLNRFEKICWLWADANRRIREHETRYIKFEKLISDYKYFEKNIVKYLKVHIEKKRWEKAVNQPKNMTKNYIIPHWKNWDYKLTNSFDKICGKEMKIFEYQ